MIPVNGKTSPCTPVSSNCVIWQGPDLPCIDLCNGDTVSDVIAALATKLCDFIDLACQCDPDLAGLDLKCALPVAPLPAPTNLVETLQAIIDYFCEEVGKVLDLPNLPVPECLHYYVNNVLITELPIVEWATLIGNQICVIIDAITTLNQNILNLEARIVTLEECVLPCTSSQPSDFDVVSSCIQPGQLIPISTLLLALETEFCNLRDVVGTVALINNAISAQCLFATSDQLSSDGTLGNMQGWVDNPGTLAESNTNQWLAICDIYSAVQSIQENCCPEGCDGFYLGYTYNLNYPGDPSATPPNSIVLNFITSAVPPGFYDCGGSSVVTITDANGDIVTSNINITALSTDPSGISINFGSLIVTQALMVTVNACVTDGTSQCTETSSIPVPLGLPCPTIGVTPTTDTITVDFTNTLGTGVTYTITVTNTVTLGVLGTTTISSPGATITEIFTGAVSGATYQVLVTVSQGSGSTSCDEVLVTTFGETCADTDLITTSNPADVLAALQGDDIYVGIVGDASVGPGADQYFYSPSLNKFVEIAGYIEALSAPILSNYSSTATPGEFDVDIAYGPAVGTAVETSFSADGLSWSPWIAGAIGANTLVTLITTGAVYIRVKATSGIDSSQYAIIRYDHSTDFWTVLQSPSECPATPLDPLVCPAGVQVAQQYLSCGENTYNTTGAPVESYWYFIGKTYIGGMTRYLYAGWNAAGLSTIVNCCFCPAFLVTDVIRVFCGQNGDSVTFEVPYVLGNGSPEISVITSPVLGTYVQSSAYSNQFTYTSFGSGPITGDYADTIVLQLQPDVGGACASAQSTVQIQFVPCPIGLNYVDQDIYAFINTNDYTIAEGTQIKAGLAALRVAWNTEWGYAGVLYFIPVTNTNWLGYQKAIVDDGTTISLSVDPAWVLLQILPTSWAAGASVYKASSFLIEFSNSSNGVYHDATLASGFGSGITAQPTNTYKDDYEGLNDALTGSAVSTWAQGVPIGAPVYTENLSIINYTMVDPTSLSGAAAANILQLLACYTGELISGSKYGIKTSVDVTPYLLDGTGPSNPYDGATTADGTSMEPLFEISAVVPTAGALALLDQAHTADNLDEIETGTNAEFNDLLAYAVKGCDDLFPDKTALGKYIRTPVEIDPCDAAEPNVILLWNSLSGPQPADVGKIYLIETFSGDNYCGTLIDENPAVVPTDWAIDTQEQVSCSPAECITYEIITCNNALGLGQHTFFVKLDAAGALTNGDIWKIDNTSGTFSPGGGRPDWPFGTQVCVEIINNNIDRNIQDHEFEAATIAGGPYATCLLCP